MKDYPLYNVKHVENFKDFIDNIEEYGSKTAFKYRNCEWTYSDICRDVRVITSNLVKYNRKLIVIDILNSYLFALAYFAVVLSDNIAVLVEKADLDSIGIRDEYVVIDESDIKELLCKKSDKTIYTNHDEVCTIVCSSGTTSLKKGVMLSQKNLLSDMIGGMELYEYKEDSVYINFLPYTHLFGIIADLMGPLYSGAVIGVPENKLHFFDELQYYKPTNLNLPPVLVDIMHTMLLRTSDVNKSTGGELKKVMCAGARMNDEVNQLFSKYGIRIYAAYGLTECSPCVTMNRDEYYKEGSVGRVLPCCTVEIINGEVVVCGENVMLGYYNDVEATNKIKIDKKVFTGDLGYLDEDGFLYLIGRKSNLIVFEDGTKIVPELIENEINRLDWIDESLIEPVNIYGKTKINVYIVTSEKLSTNEIHILLDKMKIAGRVNKILFQDEMLKRNKLGKIMRTINN